MVWKRLSSSSFEKSFPMESISRTVFAVGDVLAKRSRLKMLEETVNVFPGSSVSFI